MLSDRFGIDMPYDGSSGFFSQKIAEISQAIDSLAIQDGPIAAAHVVLLAAGVVIFSGVAGEAFLKKPEFPMLHFS